MSSRAIIAPSGTVPFESALPLQMISGIAPKVSAANIEPVRPQPVMISS